MTINLVITGTNLSMIIYNVLAQVKFIISLSSIIPRLIINEYNYYDYEIHYLPYMYVLMIFIIYTIVTHVIL